MFLLLGAFGVMEDALEQSLGESASAKMPLRWFVYLVIEITICCAASFSIDRLRYGHNCIGTSSSATGVD